MIEKQKFTVVFEVLGQKFRTVVPAEDEGDAKAKIRRAVKFISVEHGVYSKPQTANKPKDFHSALKDIFPGFGDMFGKP